MKKWKRIAAGVLVMGVLLTGCKGSTDNEKSADKLDPENPVTITVWNYYTGAQQEAFNALTDEFNKTEGKEKGIVVKASSEGGVTDLENSVMDAAKQKVGAKELPNIFAAYTDMAYELDKLGKVADLSGYLTKKEKESYIDSYMEEGAFSGEDTLKIFPVAKATEIFMINDTDWSTFAEATGTSLDDCSTVEGLTATAQKYYEWTDGLTDAPDDGKAFFGRDAMANYMIIGAMQLGTEIFTVDDDGNATLDFDKATIRKLWDNYYVPYVNGYFSSVGRFRSDDIKTGNIVSFVGSSSGTSFFPEKVILSDEESYDIETKILPAPQFEGSEGYAVQQGAGMVVTKGSEAEIEASVTFLKWFTGVDRNIRFAVESGYLPVKKEANDIQKIEEQTDEPEGSLDAIEVSIKTVQDDILYTTKAHKNGAEARNILEYALSDKATEDRESVKALMESGMSRAEAVAQYVTDDNFEQWYSDTKAELETLED